MDVEAERDREAMRYTADSLLAVLPAGWCIYGVKLLHARVTGLPTAVAKCETAEGKTAWLEYVFDTRLTPAPDQRHNFVVTHNGKRVAPPHPFDTPQAAIAYWELVGVAH